MCFLNPITKTIAIEQDLDKLEISNCYGAPCIALKETGQHLHNLVRYPKFDQVIDLKMDMLDHDIFLKLIGKSN